MIERRPPGPRSNRFRGKPSAGNAVALVSCIPLLLGACDGERSDSSTQLAGVWEAKRDFGPDVRGPLTIGLSDGAWVAEIAGLTEPASERDGVIEFDLTEERGSFRGRLDADGSRIVGHWTQPRTMHSGSRMASPVALQAESEGRWRGDVVPFDEGCHQVR